MYIRVFTLIALSALGTVWSDETESLPGLSEPSPLADADYYVFYGDAASDQVQRRYTRSRPGSATNTHSCSRVRGVPSSHRRASIMGPRGLSTFYQKYTEAYGIPIVASSVVSDDALRRTCYIVRFLFADRYDVRNSYYKRFGRIGIIGKNQRTTDIPEHSHLPPYWNTRARGFGATINGPICTGAEENILCLRNLDKWHDEDIAIHEIAHGVEILGANYGIRGYERRLASAYNAARRRRLWANTYSMSSTHEYFAEGARAYFNVKPYSASANGVRNNIVTRDQLRSYDFTLYELVEEVFPCGNTYIKRCGATRQQEENASFRTNCVGGTGPGTGTTTGPGREVTTPTPTRTTVRPGGSCVDTNNNCAYWASTGECTNSADYMNVNCKRSCGRCDGTGTGTGGGTGGGGTGTGTGGTTCADQNRSCSSWASRGECTRNPTYMNENCKRSCDQCGTTTTCADTGEHCAHWAANGQCTNYRAYMSEHCRRSCDLC